MQRWGPTWLGVCSGRGRTQLKDLIRKAEELERDLDVRQAGRVYEVRGASSVRLTMRLPFCKVQGGCAWAWLRMVPACLCPWLQHSWQQPRASGAHTSAAHPGVWRVPRPPALAHCCTGCAQVMAPSLGAARNPSSSLGCLEALLPPRRRRSSWRPGASTCWQHAPRPSATRPTWTRSPAATRTTSA